MGLTCTSHTNVNIRSRLDNITSAKQAFMPPNVPRGNDYHKRVTTDPLVFWSLTQAIIRAVLVRRTITHWVPDLYLVFIINSSSFIL